MSPNIYLSFIIFIACGLYDETANTVRQCCAQSLLFASTPFLIRKEWIKYIVMAFIACMMHFSAVVGVVIMLFCLIRFPKWLLWGGLCLSFVLGTILMNMFANYLTIISFMIDKYHYTTTSHDAGVASGTLRYVYNIVGFSILLLYSRLVKDGKNVYLFVNLAIVGVCLYNIFFEFMEMNRLTRYCFPYIMVVLPYALRSFEKYSKVIAIGSIVVLLLAFVVKTDLSVPYSFDLRFI